MSSDKETSQKDSSSSSGENLDYSKDPPKIELPNIYPVEWTVEDQRLYDLFERPRGKYGIPHRFRGTPLILRITMTGKRRRWLIGGLCFPISKILVPQCLQKQ